MSAGLADVDHPFDAEAVDAGAVLVAPHLLFEWDGHLAALAEPLPVVAQLVGVVTAETDRDVVPWAVFAPRRRIRGHERKVALGLQLGVHDLVGDAWIVAEVAEQVRRELTAEYVPVELHGLACVAVEPQVWIEPSSHRILLALWEASRKLEAFPQANAELCRRTGLLAEPVDGRDDGVDHARRPRPVPGSSNDHQFSVGPDLRKLPRDVRRPADVQRPLHHHPRDTGEPNRVADQRSVLQKRVVSPIVGHQA